MNGYYSYIYLLNAAGTHIECRLEDNTDLIAPSGLQIGDTNKVSVTVEGNSGLTIWVPYAGFSEENEIYFNADYYQLMASNTLYSNNDPVQPYSSRTIDTYVACFLAGCRISTPSGLCAVEDLRRGDLVVAADGRAIRVKWIGRQSVVRLFLREEQAPVVITARALSSVLDGAALPEQDLKLTSDHALVLDGVLVQAGALVNGTTIRRMTAAETGEHYTVWHIETEGHEAILAEGVPAETFVDNISRRRFDNFAEYETMFGAETAVTESSLPRVMSRRQLPERLRGLGRVTEAA